MYMYYHDGEVGYASRCHTEDPLLPCNNHKTAWPSNARAALCIMMVVVVGAAQQRSAALCAVHQETRENVGRSHHIDYTYQTGAFIEMEV
jgi:hypothetical protein